MRKSNKPKNSTFSGNFLLLLTAMMLSMLMIMTSLSLAPMPSSFSSVAFASHGDDYHDDVWISEIARGNSNNDQVDGEHYGDGLIDNMISQQQSPQADARNVNSDNKVIIVENCGDGEVIINDNDEIIQTNTQSFNQEASNQVDGDDEEEEEDDG